MHIFDLTCFTIICDYHNLPVMLSGSYNSHTKTHLMTQKKLIGMYWLTQRGCDGSRPEEEADRGGGGGWGVRVELGGERLLTSNFPFFSSGSTWASLDIAASLFGIPSPSISSTIITVSHFPKLLAGNMSDLMLSPKYTTCRVKKRGWQRGQFVYCRLRHNVSMLWSNCTDFLSQQSKSVKLAHVLWPPQGEPDTRGLQNSLQPFWPSHLFCPLRLERKASWGRLHWDTFQNVSAGTHRSKL